ncbi:putative peptidase family c78 protein [Eutypa lata UCREL1]|uniref:Putative peptidase family c78 protein n=1 Tax=Eutypa lata (strain UCR-EL1) TaxID=1287681 RepID=M7T6R0_EUTLA|nr:putative peptidase family c78 protein [Eutypa lata UCREL1]
MSEMLRCPFCDFQEGEEYAMLLHIEKLHSEGKSPFIVDEREEGEEEDPRAAADNASNDEEERMFAECPIDGCGEVITLAELEDHIELHAAEEPSSVTGSLDAARLGRLEENDPPRSRRQRDGDGDAEPAQSQRNAESIAKWKRILHMPSSSSSSSSAARKQPQGAGSGPNGEKSRTRLGKAELGRYAHEDKMPDKLVNLLRKGRYISSEGMYAF